MRKNSKTTLLFNDPEFQQHLRNRFSISPTGDLLGTRGKPIAGTDNGLGYRLVTVNYRGKSLLFLGHRIVFFIAHGRVPGELDHIDGDRSNNNLFNLKETTHSANIGRIPKQIRKTTTSQFKGVSRQNKNQWKASIASRFLGSFDCEIEAARAYDKEAFIHYGPDAWLNFPQTPRPTV